jgi:hypothetical protein
MVSVMYGTGVQLLSSDLERTEVNDLAATPMIFRVGARNILGANISRCCSDVWIVVGS